VTGHDAAEALRGELVVAAFGELPAALDAWQRWREGSDWQRHVDFESFLLLPRVYRNLGGQSVEDELHSRLRGVIRRNWAANTRRIARLRPLLSLVEAVANGAVLPPPHALLCDDASAAFTAEHPRLWFPARAGALELAHALLHCGWQCSEQGVPAWCLAGYAAASGSLTLAQGGELIELHWADGDEGVPDGQRSADDFVTRTLAGAELRCFGPRGTVRYLLHGPGQGPAFRRVARVLLYLERHGDPDAWRCLLRFLDESGGSWAAAVRELAPVAVGGTPARTPPAAATPCRPAASNRLPFLQQQRHHWRRYRNALGGQAGTTAALAQLPGYLMGRWKLSKPVEIPGRLLRGLVSDWRYRR